MRIRAITWLCVVLAAGLTACPSGVQEPAYDLVIRNGRVMDPESGLDAVRDVGIRAGRIASIEAGPLHGREVLDATGRVVAPGFVDLHSHAQTPLGQDFQVQDGVTSALELESGSFPVDALGTFDPLAIAHRSRIHFGASVGHAWVRAGVLGGDGAPSGLDDSVARVASGGSGGLAGPAFSERLDASQIQALRAGLERGLDAGGLGIGLLLDYMSDAVSDAELRAVFEVAAARQAPIFVHVRRGVAGDPSGLEEVIALAETTGAPVHICHVQANAMGAIEDFLAKIRAARARGVAITTESFPYNAGSTAISAAVFSRDWRRIFDIDYADVEWSATGERMTEARWHELRRSHPEGLVIHHYNQEAWTRVATLAPDVIVASDGMPVLSLSSKVVPNGIGTFSRVLSRYVGEPQGLDLMTALSKMSWQPARLLEGIAPVFRRKGRIAPGADADLVVFDPHALQDRASYAEPFRPPEGIDHVLVAGTPVVRDGVLVEDTHPGKRLLGGAGESGASPRDETPGNARAEAAGGPPKG